MKQAVLICLALTLAAAVVAQPAPAPVAAPATPAATVAPAAPAPAPRLPEVVSPLRLTPDAAAALAVARSRQVAINAQQVIAAQGKLDEVGSMSRPQVKASAAYIRRGPEVNVEFGDATINMAPANLHNEAITATWPIFINGLDRKAKSAARAGIEVYQKTGLATEVQTAIGARQAVYAILRLQQLVVVAEQRLTATAEHLRIAQAMFDAGTAPRFEVVQAETEVTKAKGDVIHAKTAVAQQKAGLAALLLVPQTTELVLEEGVPPQVPEGDRQALIARALDERPEIGALQATVRAREMLVRVTRGQYDPSAALVGEMTNQAATLGNAAFSWSLTASLTVPIYTGGEKEAKLKQVQTDVEIARLNLDQTEQQIALQVTQALLSAEDAREALKVAEQGEVEARERARIAQVRFGSGVGLGVEVLDAQTALALAQTQTVNARYDLQVATAALRAALGLAEVTKESGP